MQWGCRRPKAVALLVGHPSQSATTEADGESNVIWAMMVDKRAYGRRVCWTSVQNSRGPINVQRCREREGRVFRTRQVQAWNGWGVVWKVIARRCTRTRTTRRTGQVQPRNCRAAVGDGQREQGARHGGEQVCISCWARHKRVVRKRPECVRQRDVGLLRANIQEDRTR